MESSSKLIQKVEYLVNLGVLAGVVSHKEKAEIQLMVICPACENILTCEGPGIFQKLLDGVPIEEIRKLSEKILEKEEKPTARVVHLSEFVKAPDEF